jgi:phosphoglycerate dehydrogenase-like enzyme
VTGDPVVVGILYPAAWYGDPDGFAAEVTAIEEVDPRVRVVVEPYEEGHDMRTARGAGAGVDPNAAPPLTAVQREVFGRIDVAVAIDLPFDVASVAPRLRWVQAVGAGTGQLQSAGLQAAGIRLTSNGGSNSVAIAEFAFGRLLESIKEFPALARSQAEHSWQPRFGRQVAGRTLGLIGYGPINRAVATRAAAFGMLVLVTRQTRTAPAEPPVERFYAPDELGAMLAASDAVIAAVPETPETIDMLGRDAIAAMRPGAWLCNVGRGTLLDESALIDALRSGALSGAALDVTRVEPLPVDDPLWDAPNLTLSPHCSTAPSAMFPNLHRLFADNLRRFINAQPLLHEVQLDRGY